MGLFDKLFDKNKKSEEDAKSWVQQGRNFLQIHNNHYLAIDAFDKAILIDPKLPSAWFYKARTYEKMGDLENALLCYRSAANLGDSEASQRLRGLERKMQRK
jgi:Tfp pilus assembly protein PilF